MSLLIISETTKVNGWTDAWIKALHHQDNNLNIEIWPNVSNPDAVEFALAWIYPTGELRKYPQLKCVSSTGAGVDHILKDPQLPENIAVVRLIDEHLVSNMTQYVVWAVLNHLRGFDAYAQAQARNLWTPHTVPHHLRIGIMGLGQLGSDVAQKLNALGLNVAGWSQSTKQLPGVKSYAGNQQLPDFLNTTDILICLLPLTPETRDILNRDTFAQLRRGAYVINVARGDHLVDADLITAIDNQQLSGACLDVFQQEPLPSSHPFWQHPRIKLTPHISSITNPKAAAEQIIENYHRALAGKPLLNQVDLKKGY